MFRPHRFIAPLTLLGVALVSVACGGGGSSGTASSSTPQSILSAMTSAASGASSVHFVEVTTSGTHRSTLSGDLSAPTAREAVVTGQDHLQVELTNGVVYVTGAAAGLQNALGLTAAEAEATGGKWVAVHSGDAPFTSLTQALTLSSELGSYVPVNPGLRELATVHIHGHAATPVTGSPSSTASQGATGSVTLFVSASGPKVPIGATMVLTKGKARETKVVAFTKWGAPVDLSPPAGAVDYATLVRG